MTIHRHDSEGDALWNQIASTVRPLAPSRDPSREAPARNEEHESSSASRTPTSRPIVKSVPKRDTASLDRNTATRLRKGKITPDYRLDLHGSTFEQARRRVDNCLSERIASGDRLLLFITGRGGRKLASETAPEPGAIRAALPDWVRSGRFSHRIVTVSQAHRSHGGEGAFYVYLKKPDRR